MMLLLGRGLHVEQQFIETPDSGWHNWRFLLILDHHEATAGAVQRRTTNAADGRHQDDCQLHDGCALGISCSSDNHSAHQVGCAVGFMGSVYSLFISQDATYFHSIYSSSRVTAICDHSVGND